eukprot:781094-Pelagomonas_calceolata.AAC.3
MPERPAVVEWAHERPMVIKTIEHKKIRLMEVVVCFITWSRFRNPSTCSEGVSKGVRALWAANEASSCIQASVSSRLGVRIDKADSPGEGANGPCTSKWSNKQSEQSKTGCGLTRQTSEGANRSCMSKWNVGY